MNHLVTKFPTWPYICSIQSYRGKVQVFAGAAWVPVERQDLAVPIAEGLGKVLNAGSQRTPSIV